jgi:hypothetical protein
MAETTLPESRAELLTELDEQRRLRGIAILDGLTYDSARIAAIEAALSAQDDADAVAREREIAEQAEREARRIVELRSAIKQLDTERLTAIENARQAFDYSIAELQRVFALTAQIRSAGLELRAPSQVALDRVVLETRISRWIGARLLQLAGHMYEFGDIAVHGSPPVCSDWRAAEHTITAPAVAVLASADAGLGSRTPSPALPIASAPLNDRATAVSEGE